MLERKKSTKNADSYMFMIEIQKSKNKSHNILANSEYLIQADQSSNELSLVILLLYYKFDPFLKLVFKCYLFTSNS